MRRSSSRLVGEIRLSKMPGPNPLSGFCRDLLQTKGPCYQPRPSWLPAMRHPLSGALWVQSRKTESDQAISAWLSSKIKHRERGRDEGESSYYKGDWSGLACLIVWKHCLEIKVPNLGSGLTSSQGDVGSHTTTNQTCVCVHGSGSVCRTGGMPGLKEAWRLGI